jgi:cobalt/nickel transport system ATP-binding protein
MSLNAIEIENLSYSYPDGTCALEGVTLSIPEGQSVGIIGPNGAGKSTLLLHLNGTLTGKGSVKVFGREVERKNLQDIRKTVGLVFQNPDDQLFCPTLYEDVAFGLKNLGVPGDEIDKRVAEALAAVNLAGLEGKSSFHLSLGQKKAASLATVLVMKPKTIAFDEPTQFLDTKVERALLEIIKSLECTKIIVTHDIILAAEICDRFVFLNSGKIVGDHMRDDFLEDKQLLKAFDLDKDYRYRILRQLPF